MAEICHHRKGFKSLKVYNVCQYTSIKHDIEISGLKVKVTLKVFKCQRENDYRASKRPLSGKGILIKKKRITIRIDSDKMAK